MNIRPPEYVLQTNHLRGEIWLRKRGLDQQYHDFCLIETRTPAEKQAIRAGVLDPIDANRRLVQIASQLDDLLEEVGIHTGTIEHLS